MALFLLLTGFGLTIAGIALMSNHKTKTQGIAFFIVGIGCLLPGGFYTTKIFRFYSNKSKE